MLSYKKILRTKIAYSVICWIASKYIKFVSLTLKWSYLNKNYAEKLWKNNENFILCFWHGRLLMMPLSWKKEKKINMLISEHPDGQLISKTVKYFGINRIHLISYLWLKVIFLIAILLFPVYVWVIL